MFSRADHGPGEGLARSSRASLDGRRRVIVAAVRPELAEAVAISLALDPSER